MKKSLLFFAYSLLFVFPFIAVAEEGEKQPFDKKVLLEQLKIEKNNSLFIENKGQWSEEVCYMAKTGGMNAWITTSGVVYNYYKIEKDPKHSDINIKQSATPHINGGNENSRIKGHVVIMEFKNSSMPTFISLEKEKTYYNYFLGSDKSNWASFVPLCREVTVKNIYDGIDVRYYYDNHQIRYDYICAPGADLTQIKITLMGQDGLTVNSDGELEINTILGTVKHGRIFAYQNIKKDNHETNVREIGCNYKINHDGSVSFQIDEYDDSHHLIIDPLVYSTYFGGNDDDVIYDIAINQDKDIYITGITESNDFPLKPGGYDLNLDGKNDVFVSKFSSPENGSPKLIYSTFLGGSYDECSYALALDQNGNSYITGYTNSNDYCITEGSYQTSRIDDEEVFVTKLNSEGNDLIFSTFLGANLKDIATSIKVDASNNIYVSGHTYSYDKYSSYVNFPTTDNALQRTLSGRHGSDCFISKFNPDGTSLIFSTYFGGSSYEELNDMAIDQEGNVYITGYTRSEEDFPTTFGAYDKIYNSGITDGFFAKINKFGAEILYSTYLGGVKYDYGKSIEVDEYGYVYLASTTSSNNFPVSLNAFSKVRQGGYDIIYSKFSPNNNGQDDLVYSTYIGGSSDEKSPILRLTNNADVLICGVTNSNNLDIINNALFNEYNGYSEIFACLIADETVKYLTYFGGRLWDEINGFVLDNNNLLYLSGFTQSIDFPLTSDAYLNTTTKYRDIGFISVVDLEIGLNINVFPPKNLTIVEGNLELKLDWDASETEGVKYNVYRSITSGDYVSPIAIGIENTSYTDTGLEYGTKYYYVVRAFDESENKESGNSNEVSGRPYIAIDFKPEIDGFSFKNDPDPMWPQSWWKPNCEEQPYYDWEFMSWSGRFYFPCKYFPDWNLFVEAYGREQTYINESYEPSAVHKWSSIFKKWGGSCYGLAISSLRYYCNYMPLPNGIENTYDLTIKDNDNTGDFNRININKHHIYQYSNSFYKNKVHSINNSLSQTVDEIVNSFKKDKINNRSLNFNWYNQSDKLCGHTVIPYMLKRIEDQIGNEIDEIYVYDSNYDYSSTTEHKFVVEQENNKWSYPSRKDIFQTLFFYPDLYISKYNSTPDLFGIIKEDNYKNIDQILATDSSAIEVYFNPSANVIAENINGRTINNINIESLGISNAVPIIPITGGETEVIGFYMLVEGNEKLMFNYYGQTCDTNNLTIFSDKLLFDNNFKVANSNKSQQYYFDLANDSLSVISSAENPIFNLTAIRINNSYENLLSIQNSTLEKGDTIAFKLVGEGEEFKINNYGAAKQYDLYLYHASLDSATSMFKNIEFGNNELHSIKIDNWYKLNESNIVVWIDKGMDGNYEDSLCLRCFPNDIKTEFTNQQFNLSISPNPLINHTTISYNIPTSSNVKIDIYDIFGRKITALVDEYQIEGKKQIKWNTESIISGIFYIRLQTGQTQITKKIIILK